MEFFVLHVLLLQTYFLRIFPSHHSVIFPSKFVSKSQHDTFSLDAASLSLVFIFVFKTSDYSTSTTSVFIFSVFILSSLSPPSSSSFPSHSLSSSPTSICSFRYAKEEDMDVEGMPGIGEDSGWKQVRSHDPYALTAIDEKEMIIIIRWQWGKKWYGWWWNECLLRYQLIIIYQLQLQLPHQLSLIFSLVILKVHGDVFRAPESLVLFSAMLGTGWQLLLLVFAVIVYAMAGKIAVYTGSNRVYRVFVRIITLLGTQFYFLNLLILDFLNFSNVIFFIMTDLMCNSTHFLSLPRPFITRQYVRR